ncbi:hypothetical protein AAMO2058_001006300 [Amorphochlora amoebiformis]
MESKAPSQASAIWSSTPMDLSSGQNRQTNRSSSALCPPPRHLPARRSAAGKGVKRARNHGWRFNSGVARSATIVVPPPPSTLDILPMIPTEAAQHVGETCADHRSPKRYYCGEQTTSLTSQDSITKPAGSASTKWAWDEASGGLEIENSNPNLAGQSSKAVSHGRDDDQGVAPGSGSIRHSRLFLEFAPPRLNPVWRSAPTTPVKEVVEGQTHGGGGLGRSGTASGSFSFELGADSRMKLMGRNTGGLSDFRRSSFGSAAGSATTSTTIFSDSSTSPWSSSYSSRIFGSNMRSYSPALRSNTSQTSPFTSFASFSQPNSQPVSQSVSRCESRSVSRSVSRSHSRSQSRSHSPSNSTSKSLNADPLAGFASPQGFALTGSGTPFSATSHAFSSNLFSPSVSEKNSRMTSPTSSRSNSPQQFASNPMSNISACPSLMLPPLPPLPPSRPPPVPKLTPHPRRQFLNRSHTKVKPCLQLNVQLTVEPPTSMECETKSTQFSCAPEGRGRHTYGYNHHSPLPATPNVKRGSHSKTFEWNIQLN